MKYDNDDGLPETIGRGIGVYILIGALVLGTCAVGYCVQPWFTQKNTENTRQSDEYITSKQTALRELYNNYNVLELRRLDLSKDPSNQEVVQGIIAQQHAIIRQMHGLADSIPSHVPDDIIIFLSTHY